MKELKVFLDRGLTPFTDPTAFNTLPNPKMTPTPMGAPRSKNPGYGF